jgi:flagellar M-ring protein FliF
VQEDSNESTPRPGGPASVGNALPGQTLPATVETANSSSTRTEETVNYEISKSTTTQVQDAGTVKKLSVAVVVDGTYAQAADGARTYAPRSAEDMGNITALVRSAIGFSEQRGDQLQVTNMRFADIDTGPEAPGSQPPLGIDSAVWFKLGQILILSVTALLVFLLVVRPMIARLVAADGNAASLAAAAALPASGDQNAQAIAQAGGGGAQGTPAQIAGAGGQPLAIPKRESAIDLSQIEGQVRESAVRKVGDVVQAHPEEAMAILRTWLHQPV